MEQQAPTAVLPAGTEPSHSAAATQTEFDRKLAEMLKEREKLEKDVFKGEIKINNQYDNLIEYNANPNVFGSSPSEDEVKEGVNKRKIPSEMQHEIKKIRAVMGEGEWTDTGGHICNSCAIEAGVDIRCRCKWKCSRHRLEGLPVGTVARDLVTWWRRGLGRGRGDSTPARDEGHGM